MQYQPATPVEPLTLESHVGFTYNSLTRTFSCLGQFFSNVSLFEIEIYREIAIHNHNHNHRPAKKLTDPVVTPKKAPITAKPEFKGRSKQSVKRPSPKKPVTQDRKPVAPKAKSTKPVQRKKSN